MADDWFKQNAPSSGDWFSQNAPGKDVPLGEQPASFGGVAQTMAGQAGRALGAAWEDFSPLQTINALLPWNQPDTVKKAFNATTDALGRTGAAMGMGDYKDAALSATGAIPLVGPAVEQVSRDVASGNIPEAVGHVGGMAAMGYLLPKGIAAAGRTTAMLESAPEFMGGAAKAIPGEVRGLLTGINPLEHPLKVLPDLYDAFSRIKAAGQEATAPEFPPGLDEPFRPNPAIARKMGSAGNLRPPPGRSFNTKTPSVRPSQRFSEPPATAPSTTAATDPMLDQISQQYYGKKFANLTEQRQIDGVKAVFDAAKHSQPGPANSIPPPPSSEQPLTASELKAMNQQVNRDAHVNARDIFGSNVGHDILHDAAKQVYNTDSWGKLTLQQKTAINEYIQSNQTQLMKLNDPAKIIQAIKHGIAK